MLPDSGSHQPTGVGAPRRTSRPGPGCYNFAPMPEGAPNSSTYGRSSGPDPQAATRRKSRATDRRGSATAVSILLLSILLGAAVLRVVHLKDLPAGLFCDEAALGYNSWAILHYGVDENGVRLPLFLWSFTGYKNPVYLYASMLPIGLFGLDEFSLRLTSVAFGVATILALFLLGRALAGEKAGLAAAALLAICPWHIHFSRIAFEVISFPLLFSLGLLFLIRFTRGERTLPLAFLFLGICLYAYAIAKLFVPLFLIGFGLISLPTLWRRFREWMVAVPVLLATVAPVAVFDYIHRQRGNAYFRANSILRQPLPEVVKQFERNYATFFSPRFLFQEGDGIVRHAVRGHGELDLFFAPFLLLGLGVLLLRRNRETKLVLLWLLLYPVGASLMNEIPSASRGLIGSAAFCLIAGIGVAFLLDGLARVNRRPAVSIALQGAAVAGLVALASVQTVGYLRLYFREYPKYSAPTYGGFQYGYRDVLKWMEPQRSRYARLMLTATDVNQPQIFPLFYNRVDPRQYARTGDPGYLVLVPGEYARYSLAKPILYALRESDLDTFTDYTVQKRIVAPGGQLEFVVAEVRARKNYITDWQTLGPFPNTDGNGIHTDFIDVHAISRRRYTTPEGPTYWREYRPQFVHLNLDTLYPPGQKEGSEASAGVCGYFLTVARVPARRRALLELSGSNSTARVWLNGQSLTPLALTLGTEPKSHEADLTEEGNGLLIESCKDAAAGYLLARLVSEDRRDMPDIRYEATVPEGTPPPAVPLTSNLQLIEGFDKILSFQHEGDYPDYRGGAPSWWAYREDGVPEIRWLTALCTNRMTTVVAFTASAAEDPGRPELWIDGQYALTFETGSEIRRKTWQRGGYRLMFVSKQMISGNSGLYLLTVPASSVAPGKPLELRVVAAGDAANPWFMIKPYRDTVSHEGLTAAAVAELEGPSWKE